MVKPLIIATRGSMLALVQANYVKESLSELVPERPVQIQIFQTTGDRLQSAAPQSSSDPLPKGLFTKELEKALLNGRADLAVHSLKDLPTELPEGLCLAAVSPREDPRDVLLSRRPIPDPDRPLASLPTGGTIGTGSMRRDAFVKSVPCLRTQPIRGNVPTRIRRLAETPALDGIILAAAGLIRLGYSVRPLDTMTGPEVPPGIYAAPIPAVDMIPSPGQGALGLEARSEDAELRNQLERFNHLPTRLCVDAERAFLQAVGGGCQSPAAAHAQLRGRRLRLLAAKPDNDRLTIVEGSAEPTEGTRLAEQLAGQLLWQGPALEPAKPDGENFP